MAFKFELGQLFIAEANPKEHRALTVWEVVGVDSHFVKFVESNASDPNRWVVSGAIVSISYWLDKGEIKFTGHKIR